MQSRLVRPKLAENNALLMKRCFKTSEVPPHILRSAKMAIRKNHKFLDDVLDARSEMEMHAPLARLIDLIVNAATTRPRRVTHVSSDLHLDANLPILLERNNPPALVTLDVPPSEDGRSQWAHVSATWEIAPDSGDSDDEGQLRPLYLDLEDLCALSAEACRARMACRANQIFSLSVIFSGWRFRGVICDRHGVTTSSVYTIDSVDGAGVDMLARLAIQINDRLTEVDLGLDPTIMFRSPSRVPCSDNTAVATVELEGKRWTLVKRMFQSVTLVGHGTSIYLVEDTLGTRRIMKSSWGEADRPSELRQYHEILKALEVRKESWPRELGRMHVAPDGGNLGRSRVVGGRTLRAPKQLDAVIDAGLWGCTKIASPRDPGHPLVLNRVVLPNLGRPLWEYSEALEIVLAMRDCVKGLDKLHDLGFVHKGINAGNVLLMVRDRPFAEDLETLNQFGFLIDYELLCASEPVRDHAMYVVTSPQFMAFEQLLSIRDNRRRSGKLMAVLAGRPHHDLEAIVHVFIYAVARHELIETERVLEAQKGLTPDADLCRRRDVLKNFLDDNFGSDSYDTMICSRINLRDVFPADAFKHTGLLSLMWKLILFVWYHTIQEMDWDPDMADSHYARTAPRRIPLKSESVLLVLEQTLAELRAQRTNKSR